MQKKTLPKSKSKHVYEIDQSIKIEDTNKTTKKNEFEINFSRIGKGSRAHVEANKARKGGFKDLAVNSTEVLSYYEKISKKQRLGVL